MTRSRGLDHRAPDVEDIDAVDLGSRRPRVFRLGPLTSRMRMREGSLQQTKSSLICMRLSDIYRSAVYKWRLAMARAIPESAMNVLASLIPKPQYGYAIRKEVLDRTNGEVDLTFGTLYEQI